LLVAGTKAAGAEAPAEEVVPLKQYQRAVLKAKSYHAEARQLAAQLRRMTAKAAKLKKAAESLRWASRRQAGRQTGAAFTCSMLAGAVLALSRTLAALLFPEH